MGGVLIKSFLAALTGAAVLSLAAYYDYTSTQVRNAVPRIHFTQSVRDSVYEEAPSESRQSVTSQRPWPESVCFPRLFPGATGHPLA